MDFTHGTLVQSRHGTQDRQEPDFVDYTPPDHSRIEIRKDLDHNRTQPLPQLPLRRTSFRHRTAVHRKKTGEHSSEIAYGITSLIISSI